MPAVRPEVDTYVTAEQMSAELDVETTRLLLGEVPAAFHAGVQDILLIAFGLAWTEFLGNGGSPIGIGVEGHGRHEELAPNVDLSRTVGWFTTKYPVSLAVGGLDWAQVMAGDAALGPSPPRRLPRSGITAPERVTEQPSAESIRRIRSTAVDSPPRYRVRTIISTSSVTAPA